MKKQEKDFLKKLVEAHGSPGYEQGVQKLFREFIDGTCDTVRTDVMGSVIGTLGDKGPKIMLDGHADEIGFLVRYIDDNGYLFLTPSGGWDCEVLVGQRVMVHGREGSYVGAFGKKAIHLMDPDERKKKSELHQLWIDIGAKDKEDALKYVEVGDFVTMHVGFEELLNGCATSKAFDNRTGIFTVAQALKNIDKSKLKAQVVGVSAVQEEIGLRGAQAAAYGIAPDVAIAIDVTHGTDHPDVSKRKVGEVKLGGGPVIARGPNINPRVFDRLVEVAKANDIPYQVVAAGRGTGTDGNVIQLSRSGVATAVVSIPLRYMHNPCEVVHLDDVTNTWKLLQHFCESVSDQDDWTP